jgi:hypothetical protein
LIQATLYIVKVFHSNCAWLAWVPVNLQRLLAHSQCIIFMDDTRLQEDGIRLISVHKTGFIFYVSYYICLRCYLNVQMHFVGKNNNCKFWSFLGYSSALLLLRISSLYFLSILFWAFWVYLRVVWKKSDTVPSMGDTNIFWISGFSLASQC